MHIRQSFGTVAGRVRPWIKNILLRPKTLYGKVTLLATVGGALMLCAVFLTFFDTGTPKVSADVVTTSVTVLNTPPAWTIEVQEDNHDSSTSTPTNAGDTIVWRALATDSSSDNYWLLICKNGAAPTANSNAAPTCNGGAVNQWAVSVGTTTGGGTSSNVMAYAATTTKEGYPFNNEKNDWFGFVCDGNPALPLCNALVKQGTSTPGPSPFFIDHPPAFFNLTANGGQNPGGTETWTATASTTDVIRMATLGSDKLRLFVCKAADFTFSSTTAACGAGGTWATTTIAVATNPTASYTLPIPTQDKTYSAFVYLVNNFNLAATSSLFEASSSPYAANNVAPTVTASLINLWDRTGSTTPSISLVTPNGLSTGYAVNVVVNDNNGCINASAGNEIASVAPNVYRNGGTVSSTTCLGGIYNANNCITATSTYSGFVCTQDPVAPGYTNACVPGSVSASWTCTFPYWYTADPTDTGSAFAGQKWTADVVATDDNGATSSLTESTTGGKTLNSLTAISTVQSTIQYGGLQPGQQIDPFVAATSTTLKTIGNTGVDESLYGETMCPGWSSTPNQNYCDSNNNFDVTKDVFISNQKVATSTVSYANGFTMQSSTTPLLFGLHVPKTTVTSTPQQKDTLWAIKIPSAITQAGAYTGQNTIIAVTSSSTNW